MRGTWGKFEFSAAVLILSAFFAIGQEFRLFAQTTTPDYEHVLTQQPPPPGLKLTLTLPKDHFYQGEIIDGTLTYSYTGKDSYTVQLARSDRSGRVQDIHFFGQDEKGAAVDDPIGWIYFMGVAGGGPVEIKALGTASVTLTINQWLRFDHPGTYTIFADTTSVHCGTEKTMNIENSPHMLSNKVTVTIAPLPPDQEKKIIDDAMGQIVAAYDRHDDPNLTNAANEENAHKNAYAATPAIEILRYLQTPAARAALRSRLDKTPEYMLVGGHFEMETAFLGAPDRPKEAALILADVQAGKLKVDSSLIGLYTQLKSYPQFIDHIQWERRTITPAEIPQRQAVDAAWEKTQKDAQKEILAAATQAASKTGSSNLDLVWMAFQNNPFDPDYRAPVVAHQLDFDHQRQLRLLDMIVGYFCNRMTPSDKNLTPDFLPLVHLYLGSPAYNRNALIILSFARPQEAHDITLADWASPKHHYFNYEHQDDDAPMGKLAVTLLENRQIKWTDEQKQILDRMRR